MVNDYDHYAALRQKELQKGQKLPHRFVEKPAMRKVLPDLKDKKVLMLGCGTGEESMLLEEFGATGMVGVDLSEESVRLANETYPKHQFAVGDMHKLDLADQSFDFVYSSLTIHYSDRPLDVYKEMYRLLKPGGILQFSIGHPMRWASARITIDGTPTKLLGYTEGESKPTLYGSYNHFAKYQETFRSGEVLEFWVGPPSLHFNLLKEAGFRIEEFIETAAVEECKEVDANYYDRFSNFPQFVVFVAKK
jgi:ubiquinone/menaquinone biosynthesis C-methylase UbiE